MSNVTFVPTSLLTPSPSKSNGNCNEIYPLVFFSLMGVACLSLAVYVYWKNRHRDRERAYSNGSSNPFEPETHYGEDSSMQPFIQKQKHASYSYVVEVSILLALIGFSATAYYACEYASCDSARRLSDADAPEGIFSAMTSVFFKTMSPINPAASHLRAAP
ncbi:MAG: hypothetical protein V4496_02475 [Pseudomonadota bacterium]